MTTEGRLKHLQEAHELLDNRIDTLEKTGVYEDYQIEEMKKQRLILKDEIAKLQLKQQLNG